MDLSRTTLVILSHNRQHCLRKTLQFYKFTNINILVLDNSETPLHADFVPRNCNYLNSSEPFAIRSEMASKLITTPYTIIGADDEIYLPSSIQKMQDFLDVNLDYVAAGGYAIAIWEYGPTIAASWAYKRTYQYHNDGETPLARIDKHTGHGSSPITSFFTCNLTRTFAAQDCLSMYAKAPVLATDAISVLTICGAGKSKYLDIVYWVRNWNQSPRSHSGWDRRVFLHEWWLNPANFSAKRVFLNDLSNTYRKHTQNDDFSEAWELILKSDEALQRQISWAINKFRIWGEDRYIKNLKYHVKRVFKKNSLPTTVAELTNEMNALNIFIPEPELEQAASLVSKLLPYESWR